MKLSIFYHFPGLVKTLKCGSESGWEEEKRKLLAEMNYFFLNYSDILSFQVQRKDECAVTFPSKKHVFFFFFFTKQHTLASFSKTNQITLYRKQNTKPRNFQVHPTEIIVFRGRITLRVILGP